MLIKKFLITEHQIEIDRITEMYDYKLLKDQWSNTNKECKKQKNVPFSGAVQSKESK